MLDKQEFYHGVAIVKILDDPRYVSLRKDENGYLVNEAVLVFLKYSTKARSPWRFTFSHTDVVRLKELSKSGRRVVAALVCGGDGVCAVAWELIEGILANETGWVAVRRQFNESYAVSGPNGQLPRKVTVLQWPSILFSPHCNDRETPESFAEVEGGNNE